MSLSYFRSQLAHLKNARVIFLLGKVGSSQVQEQLHAEHLVHGDILQNTGTRGHTTEYRYTGTYFRIQVHGDILQNAGTRGHNS